MIIRVLLALTVIIIASGASAQNGDPFSPESTARYPVMRVPPGPKPTLSGVFEVESQEWRPAHQSHDFIAIDGDDKGAAGQYPTNAILKYNAEALYVGFKTEMPVGAKPKISATTGRDVGMADDGFEIFLSPDDNKTIFQIGGNAAGITWERKFIDGKAQDWNAWNPNVTLKTQVENAYWTGEWEIPWKEFGIAPPQPESIWRVNFVSKRKTPKPQIEAWSYWREDLDFASNGRMIIGDKNQPQFYMMQGWKQGWKSDGSGMWPNLTPAWDAPPQKVETIVELRRRDISPATPQTFLTELQARRNKAEGEGGTFAPLGEDVNDVLKSFNDTPYSVRDTIQIPYEGDGRFAPRLTYEAGGDYVLQYYYRDVTNPAKPFLIAGGALPFRIRQGVQLDVTPYLLTRQSVVASADLRAVGSKQKPARLRASIRPEKSDKILVEKTVDYPKDARTTDIEISAKELPVGARYRVVVEVLDEAGKAITSGAGAFNRPPDPFWWTQRNELGAKPEVPKPWTPIEWKNGIASVWNRKLKLDDNLFPQQIESGGKGILAAPIRLEMIQDGKVVEWQKSPSKVLEQRPGNVRFESTQDGGGARVRSTHNFEFDGFSEYNLWVEPEGEKVAVDELDLVIPLKAEYAQFLTNYANAPGPAPKNIRFAGKVPDHFSSPVMITTWLGNDEDGGLELSCESARDWFIGKDKTLESIVVDKRGDTVEARFRFINERMTLDRARHFRFGLIATPTKPLTPMQRNWKIDPISLSLKVPGQKDSFTIVKDNNQWKEESVKHSDDTVRQFFEYYDGYDVLVFFSPQDWATENGSPWPERVRDPEIRQHIKDQEKVLREHGVIAARYGGWGVWTGAEDYDPWGKEMLASPREPTIWDQYVHTYESPFVEWAVGSWAMNARELGVRGVRFDTVFPWWSSANPYYDEAWVSETDGKTYGKFGLFRAREYMKKLYRIFNGGEVDEGIIYHPAGGPPMMLIESFMTIRETGEGFYMKANSLKEGYDQNAMRVWMSGRPYGFLEMASIKGEPLAPNNRIGALLAAGITPRMMHRIIVDVPAYAPLSYLMPATAIRDAWQWVDRGTAQFHPHWKNKDLVTSSSDAGEHYVSFYSQPGKKVLLVATNYEKKDAVVNIKLGLAKIGFQPDVKLEAKDAITGEAIEIKDGVLALQCGPELYRLVKIGDPETLK